MRGYVFVDAENHFLRSIAAAQDAIGHPRAAEAFGIAKIACTSMTRFPESISGQRFGWDRELQLFWDCQWLSRGGMLSALGAEVSRAVYACACTGDENKAHEMRVRLRELSFEPIVVREPKNQRAKRDSAVKQHGLIEKAKGCDIALATRMVADAAADLYDCCFLFTSDADFLPAVEAVRRMGKVVWVFGYRSALGSRSPYLYVPDRFIDLGPVLRTSWFNASEATKAALQTLTNHDDCEASED